MALNLQNIVPLRTLPKVVEAGCYNRIRLALARRNNPLHIELPTLRIQFILDKKAWLAISSINEAPLLAWTVFNTKQRALHEPVTCQLHLYHIHAGLIMGTALEALDAAVKTMSESHIECLRPLTYLR